MPFSLLKIRGLATTAELILFVGGFMFQESSLRERKRIRMFLFYSESIELGLKLGS